MSTEAADKAALIDQYKKGKTKEQAAVVDFFCLQPGCGCLNNVMSEDEYLKKVFATRDSMNFRAKALSKAGVDEEEVKEIPPVIFEGFVFDNAFAKRCANGNWVSSSYQVSWMFFSSSQVFIYSYTFHMDEDKKKERTDEFFYKDVVSFTTTSETETAHDIENKKFEIQTNKLVMVVPGDKLYISMDGSGNTESVIQGMKQKLREKKL